MLTGMTVTGYRVGERGFRRITLAVSAAGMTTFVAMYAAQAVLPQIATEFDSSPAATALTISATTGMLALMVVPISVLSERFGRLRIMSVSALLSVVIGLLQPWAPSLELLVAMRGLQGIALAGVPATAMAYLAEEVHPDDVGAAMGKYIAGTTLGGLAGRLIPSLTLEVGTWRWGMMAAAAASFCFATATAFLAPKSRHFVARPVGWRTTASHLKTHLKTPALVAMFGTGFLLMGGFVSVYNFLGFRLLAAPFDLPDVVVGLIFLMFLAGTVSASAAGRLADRLGPRRVLVTSEMVMLGGLLLTWPDHLVPVLIGAFLLTAGFFGAHAVASGWVGRLATEHRAEASSLYLLAYYAGSSVMGALAGLAFAAAAWTGVVLYVGGLVLAAAALVVASQRSRVARAADTVTPCDSVL
ncbi:MFS transporter [Demetria terragena]|uniref:MFS transporter n=1 Tax=Demetria terragena TaxID=63959 RepID=UPI00036E1FE9|nr:MFS transporter [Demetria terragena]